MNCYKRVFELLVGVLLLAPVSVAQIQFGNGITLKDAAGVVGAGYGASYGNLTNSEHTLDVNGSGSADGYFYSPNLLSFSAQPYYGQSRDNSSSQSISNSSGINLSSGLFAGTQFPGSITFAKAYNSIGSFAVPGLADYTTRTNGDALGVSWAANLRELPSVQFTYQKSNSAYSIYGVDTQGRSTSHAFALRSSYRLAGFGLSASYAHSVAESLTPNIVSGGTQSSNTGGDNFGFNVSHVLPLHGQFTTNYNYSDTSYDIPMSGSSGKVSFQIVNSGVSLNPWRKVTISMNGSYVNDLGGEINQQIISQGGSISSSTSQAGSNSTDLQSVVSYQATGGLTLNGEYERRMENWEGASYGASYYSGFASYARKVLGGSFGASSTIIEAVQDGKPGFTLGFADSANYARKFGAWNVSGNFHYAQNVQTLLITYMTSNYNYGGNLRRLLGRRLYLGVSAAGSRSGLAVAPGNSNSSESYSTSISTRRWFAVSGTYQKSQGQALYTSTGLANTSDTTQIIDPSQLYRFGGKSYSVSASSSPIKRLSISASYAKSISSTAANSLLSDNRMNQFRFTSQYQFRKMFVSCGYSTFTQGFGVTSGPAAHASSFYIGVSRWLKLF